jgi:predicted amidohydrolase
MENLTVACVQQRMSISATHEEFEAEARRFLRQAQAKAARLTIFPELTGVMLAPPLISGFKLGFIKREDQGKRRDAGFLSRSLGRVAGTTAGALGGGFRGSLDRLLRKKSDVLRDAYLETFGRLAREFGTAILGGSLYLYDSETETIKNRSYLFDVSGDVLGYQDKFNLAPDERDLAQPGADLTVFQVRGHRVGLLIGHDALYPELARLLAIQGIDLLVGIAAIPGTAAAGVLRSALALRAEENQVFSACSYLLGPNHLARDNREDLFGQSALMAPISLSPRGDGILVQAGTDRTEGLIAAELKMDDLYALRQTGRFRPRQEMHLGNLGPVLAEVYRQGLTIEQAIEQGIACPVEPVPEPAAFQPVEVEALEEVAEPEPEAPPPSEPEAAAPSEPEAPPPSEPEALPSESETGAEE